MTDRNIKYISCSAMAHILAPMINHDIKMVTLDIALHLNPVKLRERLQEEIVAMEEKGMDIVLGYGLCGRALEGVTSLKSRLILPRVDDCIGAILGSRQRHKSILLQQSGSYFLEPAWLGTELDIFNECTKGLDNIPEHRRSQIVQMTLRHYSKLAVLNHPGADSQAILDCQHLARSHGLECVEVAADHRLLQRLVKGDWSGEDFVMADPGQEIPFF